MEDEADLLYMAADLFRSIGYKVVTSNSDANAIETMARERDINVLLLTW